jgi:FKBP-type peptidyl-prolyl cis-trans isomerase FkpA
LKPVLATLAAAIVAAGCGAVPESKTVAASPAAVQPAAKKECTPPPKELVMKDITVGTGKEVVLRSPTFVEYTGWLYDGCAPEFKGAKFDSSVGRTTPFGFVVGGGRVIKGWDEGVMGMREKGTRLLIIPPDKGYGAQGAGNGLIPPNATLVFEVSVLNIMTP